MTYSTGAVDLDEPPVGDFARLHMHTDTPMITPTTIIELAAAAATTTGETATASGVDVDAQLFSVLQKLVEQTNSSPERRAARPVVLELAAVVLNGIWYVTVAPVLTPTGQKSVLPPP